MSTIQDLINSWQFLFLVFMALSLLVIDRFLLHRRLMREIKYEYMNHDDVDINQPEFPFVTLGLLLAGIGTGTLLEIYLGTLDGGFLFLFVGLLLILRNPIYQFLD